MQQNFTECIYKQNFAKASMETVDRGSSWTDE